MKDIERCLNDIASVRSVAAGEESAYVARSRLGRLSIAVANVVSKNLDSTPPPRLQLLPVPPNLTIEERELVQSSNRLTTIAKTLCQPSEPLDERWKRGWAELLLELENIENSLCGRIQD